MDVFLWVIAVITHDLIQSLSDRSKATAAFASVSSHRVLPGGNFFVADRQKTWYVVAK